MPVIGILMVRISPARTTAFAVLEQVTEGGYASDILRSQSCILDSRDAGLAAQIVFGSLRYQAQLDYLISLYSGRGAGELDLAVLVALRMAIFQIRYLERVPTRAAVHEAVELVKRHKRAAAGFTNAVLRKVNREPVVWPDRETEFSCPQWLLDRWADHFGEIAAQSVAEAALEEPLRYIRVPPGAEPPQGTSIEATSVPGCYRLLSSPAPAGVRLHDIGSQAIVPLLDLKPGDRYLDLCAAPGNKTFQALETPLSLAVACDISYPRLSEMPSVCPRVVLDASRPLPFQLAVDRILVDGPCSGTGTLGRNPEIKWRVQSADFARFREMQERIVLAALPLLAPGGRLVYATCSLEREENEDVVARVLAREPGVRCAGEVWRRPGRDPGDGFYAAALVSNRAT